MHPRFVTPAVLVFVCAAAAACNAPAPALAEPPPPPPAEEEAPLPDEPSTPAPSCPEGTPFHQVSGKVIVEARINGVVRQLGFDTGAPHTVFDRALSADARHAEITSMGRSTALDRVAVANLAASGLRVDGVLGMDFVGKGFVTVDYPRSRAWVADHRDEAALLACAHVEGAPDDVPYVRDGYFFVRGGVEGLDGWLLVDSGASLGGVPASVFRELDAAARRPSLPGFYTPALAGTFWARLTTLGTMRFGAHEVAAIVARTLDDDLTPVPRFPDDGRYLGLLPSDALGLFMMTIDPEEQTIRFDAARGAENRGRSAYRATGIGLGTTLATHTTISEILPGSSAERAGLRPGDVVVEIGGRSLAALDAGARAWATVSREPGKVPVVYTRGGESLTAEVTFDDVLRGP